MSEVIGENSTISSNTGTGKQRSCITEFHCAFPPGSRVRVLSRGGDGDCRGEFVISSVEYETSGFAKHLGVSPAYRIFSEDALPLGTTIGDVLVTVE